MDADKMAALIVGGPPPGAPAEGQPSPDAGGDDEDMGLHAAAEDVIAAVGSKDARALAKALRAAFEMLEAAPHEEAAETEA